MRRRVTSIVIAFLMAATVFAIPVFAETSEAGEQDFYWSEWSYEEPSETIESSKIEELKAYRYRIITTEGDTVSRTRWSTWFDDKVAWEAKKSEVTATLNDNQTLDIDSVTKYRYQCPLLQQTITGASSFTKTYGNASFNLGAKAETSLTYKSSNTKIAIVSQDGKVTMRNPGTVTITVSTPGNSMYKPVSKKVKINISLKKPVLTMKYYKSTRKVQLRWTKVPGVTKYQVYQYNYSTGKYFLKGTCSSKAIGCSWIRGSKAKTYKCKVRAYRVVDGKKVYGPFSTVKILKAK